MGRRGLRRLSLLGCLMVASCSVETGTSTPGTANSTSPATTVPAATAVATVAQPTQAGSVSATQGTVRIAAVELRPEDPAPGGQLVILVNAGARPVDVNCWVVHSATTALDATIRAEAALAPGAQLRLLTEARVFDSSDTVSLRDERGHVVDRTPALVDRAGDDQFWFRNPGGTWTFGRGFSLSSQMHDGRLVTSNSC